MNLKQDKFSACMTGFKILYMVYLLLAFNAFVNVNVWMDYAAYLMTGLGMLMCLWILVRYKDFKNIPNTIILTLFVVSNIFSSIMNLKYGYMDNIKGTIWMILPMLILYVGTTCYTREQMEKEFSILGTIYIIFCSITNIISVSMLKWGVMYDFIDSTNTARAIGFRWGRLWGAYDDPNHGAVISLAAVLFACYFLGKSKKVWQKILLILSLVIQYLYIVFADSRTAYVSFVAIALLWIFIERKGKLKKRMLLSVCTIAIFVAGIYGAKAIYNSPLIQGGIQSHITAASQTQQTPPKTTTGRKDDLKNNESNGRTDIWLSGLEIAKSTPIYGTSFRNMTEYAKANMPDTYIVNNKLADYDSMHNVVLDILVSQGIIGILIAAAFAINTLIYLWKHVRSILHCSNLSFVRMQILVVVAVAMASLFLSMIFYLSCPQVFVFWNGLGYIVAFIKRTDEQRISSMA